MSIVDLRPVKGPAVWIMLATIGLTDGGHAQISADQRSLIMVNDSGDWASFSRVSGSKQETIGEMMAAPHAKIYFSADGKSIEHGEAKFVATDGLKEIIGCHVSDGLVDFVALDVTELRWGAFGDTKEMKLLKQSVTYHLTANKTDELVEQALLLEPTVVRKSDAAILDGLRDRSKRTPNVRLSFNIKDGEKTIPATIGLMMEFNACVGAVAVPRATTPKGPSKKNP